MSKKKIIYEGYTTGAFIELKKLENKWFWVCTGFEEDSFHNGKYFDPDIELQKVRRLEQ